MRHLALLMALSYFYYLFADDMIILGDSPNDVNKSLQLLEMYCDKWCHEINSLKTEVIVFRKRGDVRANKICVYKGNVLDVVNDFNYLGTIFITRVLLP